MTNLSKCPMCNKVTLLTIEKVQDRECGDSYHVRCQNELCEWDEWLEPMLPSQLVGLSLSSVALQIIKMRGIDLTDEMWWNLREDLWDAFTDRIIEEGITESSLYDLGIGIKKKLPKKK